MKLSYNAKIMTIRQQDYRTTGLVLFLVLVVSLCFVVFADLHAGPATEEVKAVQARVDGAPRGIESAFGKYCEKLLVREIRLAKEEVLVAIYSITKWSIRDALIDAVSRGVAVRVKYDVKSAEYKGMSDAISHMKKHGVECVPVEMSDEYANMHHKFTVIDRKQVLTGSYNYTVPASSGLNYENLVLIESAEIAKHFIEEFERIKSK